MWRLYLKHLIIKVCLYFACNKDFISCFKCHNIKVCPFRDVPPLQNSRVWGGHRSSVSAFTATAFGARFTVGIQTWGKYPPPPHNLFEFGYQLLNNSPDRVLPSQHLQPPIVMDALEQCLELSVK